MEGVFSAISIISFVAAFLFLTLAIILWFVFKIPDVISDLSGKKAQKSIAQLRKQNDSKQTTASKIKTNEAKQTSKTKIRKTKDTYETGLLVENQIGNTDVEETQLLIDEEQTKPLSSEVEQNRTLKIVVTSEETKNSWFVMIEDIVFIHTQEEIIG